LFVALASNGFARNGTVTAEEFDALMTKMSVAAKLAATRGECVAQMTWSASWAASATNLT
jgi:hypothetical protein